MKRDYSDPEYKKYRRAVRKRDKYKCRWPMCEKKTGLQIHHIFPWSSFPHLKFEVDYGITLCKTHHKIVTKNELTYTNFLLSLIKDV